MPEKMVTIHWEGRHGSIYEGDAIIEYVDLVEDGKVMREVLGVYLPEGISADQKLDCKREALAQFHSGAE